MSHTKEHQEPMPPFDAVSRQVTIPDYTYAPLNRRDYEHARACVNALAGRNPEAVIELFAAVEHALLMAPTEPWKEILSSALSKVKS